MTTNFKEHETDCPHCGHHNELTTEVGGAEDEPRDGDLSLCWECGKIGVFDAAATGGLRKPTDAERPAMEAGTAEMRHQWKLMRAMQKSGVKIVVIELGKVKP